MSENASKPFEATPHRRETARREGNVARSQELIALSSFAAALAVGAGGVGLAASLAATAIRTTMVDPQHALPASSVLLLLAALVPACAAAAAGFGVSVAQAGGLHGKAITLNFGALNPAAGFKRLFGGEALVGGARAALAFLVTASAVLLVLRDAPGFASARDIGGIAHSAMNAATTSALAAVGCAAVFAFADYALARRRWLRGLRMSHDEVRREMREQEGDPVAKSRRTQMHRAFSRGAIARTAEASFVIVNPTHVAAAIRYAPQAAEVPELLVLAVDERALEVRRIAQRHGIPIIENIELARLLLRIGSAGRPIPAETFVAIAEVIAALARQGALAL